jgi:hypothetical protein
MTYLGPLTSYKCMIKPNLSLSLIIRYPNQIKTIFLWMRYYYRIVPKTRKD